MFHNLTKKCVLRATIIVSILAMAGGISTSAQSTAAVDRLPAKQSTIVEPKEKTGETKPGPAAEISDPTAAPVTASKVTPHSEASDPTKSKSETAWPPEVGEPDAARKVALPSPQTPASDGWQFQLTPYVWLPSLHGTVGVADRTSGVDESFPDLFRALKFVFMANFEAHKGKFTSLTDVEYVNISDTKATPGPLFSNVEANIKNFIFDTEGGYRVLSKPDKGSYIDVLAGIRVWHVSLDLDFGAGILPAVQAQGSRNWVDAVAGMRGKAAITKSQKFFVTGKFDLGGGGSKFTYQVFGAGGYNVNDRIALTFGYRLLDVNYNRHNLIYNLMQRGPILGLGFRF